MIRPVEDVAVPNELIRDSVVRIVMTTDFKPFDIGRRLRMVRKSCGLTQAEVAKGINVARTTLVAIEKGDRAPRVAELQQMAQMYDTSANELMGRDSVFPDIVSRFRKLHAGREGEVVEAAQVLSDLVRAEVELEDTLGITHSSNLPPERPLLPGVVQDQAEQDAGELRQWLGFASAPVRDIVSLLALDLGVRVHVRPIALSLSGLFSFSERLGACMLLNAKHSRAERVNSAARLLGCLVANRAQSSAHFSAGSARSRSEKYADRFARAFLTPAIAVKRRFQDIVAGSHRLTRRHVIVLAHSFGISREEMVRRLEDLQLIRRGARDWLEASGGSADAQAQQALGDLSLPQSRDVEATHPTTLRLHLLAAQAWSQGLLSEGQLADLLRLDRFELRKILDDQLDGRSGVNVQPQ